MRVRKLANRLIWSETEGDSPEYDLLFEELDARLGEASLAEETRHVPVETLARRIAADLGLSGHPALAVFEGAPRAPEPRASAPVKKPPRKAAAGPGPKPQIQPRPPLADTG
jgi:hypothetical protein